jgi:hypothetical protein
MLVFGGAARLCFGQNIARLSVAYSMSTLFRECPYITLAPGDNRRQLGKKRDVADVACDILVVTKLQSIYSMTLLECRGRPSCLKTLVGNASGG